MYLLLHMLCIVLSAGDIGMMILISAGIVVDGDVGGMYIGVSRASGDVGGMPWR